MSDELDEIEVVPPLDLSTPARRAPAIPDNSILVGEIVITSYMEPIRGKMMFSTNVRGDINLAQAVGLCELGKNAIVEEYERFVEDDEDA